MNTNKQANTTRDFKFAEISLEGSLFSRQHVDRSNPIFHIHGPFYTTHPRVSLAERILRVAGMLDGKNAQKLVKPLLISLHEASVDKSNNKPLYFQNYQTYYLRSEFELTPHSWIAVSKIEKERWFIKIKLFNLSDNKYGNLLSLFEEISHMREGDDFKFLTLNNSIISLS